MLKDMQIRFEKKETAQVHVVNNGLFTDQFKPALDQMDTLDVDGLFDNGALIFDVKDLKSRKVGLVSKNNAHRAGAL